MDTSDTEEQQCNTFHPLKASPRNDSSIMQSSRVSFYKPKRAKPTQGQTANKSNFEQISSDLLTMYQDISFKKRQHPSHSRVFHSSYHHTSTNPSLNKHPSKRIQKHLTYLNNEYFPCNNEPPSLSRNYNNKSPHNLGESRTFQNTKPRKYLCSNKPVISFRNNDTISNAPLFSSTVMKPISKRTISDLVHITPEIYKSKYFKSGSSSKRRVEMHFNPLPKKEAIKLKEHKDLENYTNFEIDSKLKQTNSFFN